MATTPSLRALILAVDDDASVGRAVERDLRRRYGARHRVLLADSGETGPRRLMAAARLDGSELPVLFHEDGEALVRPSQSEVATRIGLHTVAELPFYDLVIVGGGPAGLAAAVYGASEGLRTLLVERHASGGQAGQSARIENYLGFPAGLSGAEPRAARDGAGVASRGGAPHRPRGDQHRPERSGATGDTRRRQEIGCHCALIATGVHYSRLEAPGVERLTGSGIYYGSATAEASAVEGEDIVVVGAANSAGQAVVHLSGRARRVTVLCRADRLEKSMSHYLVERIRSLANVEVRTCAMVTGATGNDRLEELTVVVDGRDEQVPATSAFVFIGARPQTDWLGDTVARDPGGFILSGSAVARVEGRHRWRLERDPFLLETSLPGVLVAGDVRDQSIKRVASAVGEGSMAVQFAHQYLGGILAPAT